MGLEEILGFIKFLNKFREVERKIAIPGRDRGENDAEHSYYLAVVAWYIVSAKRLDLDLEKVIKYALVHDLIETYAGDTYIYDADKQHKESKKERETAAAERIKREFPEIPDFHSAIDAYETRSDRESRFVYALDKFLPPAMIYLDRGLSWRIHGVTPGELEGNKRPSVTISPDLQDEFGQLLDRIKAEEKSLFDKS